MNTEETLSRVTRDELYFRLGVLFGLLLALAVCLPAWWLS